MTFSFGNPAFEVDAVYLWLAALGGILFSIYLSWRMPRRMRARSIFEMGLLVFLTFSVISFFNRVLVDGLASWSVIWPFSVRWWVFIGTAAIISAIIVRLRKRRDG